MRNTLLNWFAAVGDFFSRLGGRLLRLYHPATWRQRGIVWSAGIFVATLVAIVLILGMLWSNEPAPFDVHAHALERAGGQEERMVTGHVTTATLIRVASTLLDKPGGYLSNDIAPPGVYLDNIPNWEYGVLVQVRDLSRALRSDISRSQSQSAEDPDLIIAEPQFSFDSESWMFPPSEREYRTGIRALERYLARLADEQQSDAQFYARADNLREWLAMVEKRLGSLSQRLAASVGQARVNTDLAGDAAARQSTQRPAEMVVKTPRFEVDDVFYEARGSAWALLHFLKAAEHDFGPALEKKNAVISLRQIIRELEATQQTIWSPVILNGSGFGFVTNHSLVMASYLSRANAAVIDLRNLLEQG
ncbi:MAG TPA: DUF2333 family protein [Thioalkalivibrio sp.]|nr:DUF2333 family protein [Thioalkalivibrio sp.]